MRFLIIEGVAADAKSRILALKFDTVGLRAWNLPHQDNGRDYAQFG